MRALMNWWKRRALTRRIAYRRRVLAGSGMSRHARRVYEADLWRDICALDAVR